MNKRLLLIFLISLFGPIACGQADASEGRLHLDGSDPAGQRPVVIESFTGTWCTFCYGAGMALESIQNNYPRSEVLVVIYHKDDPYSIRFANTRYNYYRVQGCPTAWFNGMIEETGGSRYQDGAQGIAVVRSVFQAWFEEERARTAGVAPFQLRLEGQIGPTDPEMKLTVSSATGYSENVNAIFLIVEDHIPVPPEEMAFNANKQTAFSAVARAHLGTEPVTLTSPGSFQINVSYAGTIPHHSEENLRPVVFLQNVTTKEIVGAVGEFSEPEPSPVSIWEVY
ncbi:MAG: hypothetical protein ABIH23_30905 [bacterium]